MTEDNIKAMAARKIQNWWRQATGYRILKNMIWDAYQNDDLSLRKYGYSVKADFDTRMYALKLAAVDYGKGPVVDRLTMLGKYHSVMLHDIVEWLGEGLNSVGLEDVEVFVF